MHTTAIRALALLSVAAGLGVAAFSSAGAREPGSELLISTCNFDQIDRAAHTIAPFESTFYMDQNPVAKTALRGWFLLPLNERVVRRDQIVSRWPGVFEPRNWMTDSPRSLQHEQQLIDIVENCHSF